MMRWSEPPSRTRSEVRSRLAIAPLTRAAPVTSTSTCSWKPTEHVRCLAALPHNVEVSSDRLERFERDGQVRLRAGATPVDLFLNVLPFHEHVERHIRHVPFEGRTIPILNCTGLVVFKAMFDRSQDWAGHRGDDRGAVIRCRGGERLDPARCSATTGGSRNCRAASQNRRSQAEPRPLRLRQDGKVEAPGPG